MIIDIILYWGIIYIMIGGVVSLFMHLLNQFQLKALGKKVEEFTNGDRIGIILYWPVVIIGFIYYFIKGYNQNK